jgi:hypothetical protein
MSSIQTEGEIQLPGSCWSREEGCGTIEVMSNLLLQHALYELLTLPEENQEEHAKAILERLDSETIHLEGD